MNELDIKDFFPKGYAPSGQELANAKKLISTILNPMRSALGCEIYITCGKRNPKANEIVGGVKSSQHLDASAVDFVMDMHNVTLFNLFKFMVDNKYPYRQIIYSRKRNLVGIPVLWIHVSINAPNHPEKHEALIEDNLSGAVKYTAYTGQQEAELFA